MEAPLNLLTVHLDPENDTGRVFDMTRRCACAVCTEGDLHIRILNVEYHVTSRCVFACMPFVDIEVVSVSQPADIMFGYLQIEDMPRMINRRINTDNLSAIQNHPLVEVPEKDFQRLMTLFNDYEKDYSKVTSGIENNALNLMQQDIIELQCRLIIAQVLKIYFTYLPMEVKGYTHRNIIFQQFMLALYTNFREHRNVRFYAMRSGVSLKYFSTIIRQLSGASPSDWIETVVIGEAKSMLSDVNNSIKDIASALNFPDAPTFTKYFHRVTGLTPKKYRRK